MIRVSWETAKKKAIKKIDAWSEVILCDPISMPLAYVIARYTNVSSMSLVIFTLILRILSGVFFSINYIIAGIVLFYFAFIMDGTDGKVARILGENESLRGAMDFILDQVGMGFMLLGLALLCGKFNYDLAVVIIVIWLILYCIILAEMSTLYRLIGKSNVSSTSKSKESQEYYINGASRLGNRYKQLTLKLLFLYSLMKKRTESKRLLAVPTGVDSQMVLFAIVPLTVLFTTNVVYIYAFLIVALCLLIPEIIAAFIRIMIHAKELMARNELSEHD